MPLSNILLAYYFTGQPEKSGVVTINNGTEPLQGNVVEDENDPFDPILISESLDTSFTNLMIGLGIQESFNSAIGPISIIQLNGGVLYRTIMYEENVVNKNFFPSSSYQVTPFISYSSSPDTLKFLFISKIELYKLVQENRDIGVVEGSTVPFQIYGNPKRVDDIVRDYFYVKIGVNSDISTRPVLEIEDSATSGSAGAGASTDESGNAANPPLNGPEQSGRIVSSPIDPNRYQAPRPPGTAAPPPRAPPRATLPSVAPAFLSSPSSFSTPHAPPAAASIAPIAPLAPLASARVEEPLGKPAKAADDRLMDERQVAGLGAAAFAIAALGFLSAL
jgi:hypothetical protein